MSEGKLRTFGEKETYKYLGILKVNSIKHVDMKEKNKKKRNAPGERENYSKPNCMPEISLK